MDKKELNKMINAAIIPVVFVAIIGLIHLLSFSLEINMTKFALFPRSEKGLIGIITSPLIHGDFSHLFNNSIPLLILGTALFYFYREIAFKVSTWIYLMVGIWTWVSAREAYHIGASGVLYGVFSFLLVSGFLRRNKNLISLSFVVTFLYGSLVWGIFPIDLKISFEGHMWGFIAGIVLAIYFRKQGPQKVEYQWPEEDELDDENDFWNEGKPRSTTEVNYFYVENNKEGENKS